MTKSLRKNKALALYALAFMASINLNAQTWTGTTDTDFATATNWDTGVAPGAGVAITIPLATNNPVLATATTAVCTTLGINVGGILTVKGTLTPSAASYTGGTIVIDGGNINVRSNFNLGVTNNPSTVTLNSGTLNARSALIVGEKGNCDLNINGGIAGVDQGSSGGAIIIGGYYAVGIVNLNGGTLKTRASLIGTAALAIQEQPTRSGTGYLKIDGGTLEMGGDQTAFIDAYVLAGKIVPGVGKRIERVFLAATPGDATAVPPIPATTAKTLVTAVTNLGINKNMEKNFSVYPNPGNGIINIDAKNNNLGNLNISVYNLLGQQVLERVLDNNNSGTYRLDATNKLSSGTYIVNIKSGSSSYNSKIVVQ